MYQSNARLTTPKCSDMQACRHFAVRLVGNFLLNNSSKSSCVAFSFIAQSITTFMTSCSCSSVTVAYTFNIILNDGLLCKICSGDSNQILFPSPENSSGKYRVKLSKKSNYALYQNGHQTLFGIDLWTVFSGCMTTPGFFN